MITPYTTKHAYRAEVYPVIARHLKGVKPVSTGLVVKSLAEPYIDFEIDVWAVIPTDLKKGHDRFHLVNTKGGYLMPQLDFENAKVVRANNHVFLQGQTGLTLEGDGFVGDGNPAAQTEKAMENVRELLEGAGAKLEDICKVTTYVTDASFRKEVYPVLARHLKGVAPVSTGIVVKALARPELNFEIDVFAMTSPNNGTGHERFRPSPPNYLPSLDYTLSKAVRAGNFVFLQGQTGLALDGSGLIGRGDPAAQAERAMQNVKELLEEVGSDIQDICKITPYVTEQSYRAAVYPVIDHYLKGVNPTSTGIVAKALAAPELDFEIDVFAVIPED
jgi:enamine deaminase RidA (YjgF/YER057c/UK114 family)